MPKTVVIVQARMTSTRLPGKVMMDIAGHTVLAHVLCRCARIENIDAVCCAMPQGTVHDPIAREAEANNALIFRGSEEDVLDRYWQAARILNADIVMRITSDCPLADPQVCTEVLRLVMEGKADYACNNMPATWPHGLDCEAFTFAALDYAAHAARDPFEREHVTPWLRNNPDIRKVNLPGPGGWSAEQRWTLDFPEDLEFFRVLFAAMPSSSPILASTDDVLTMLRSRPDIAAINSHHHNISRPSVPSFIQELP